MQRHRHTQQYCGLYWNSSREPVTPAQLQAHTPKTPTAPRKRKASDHAVDSVSQRTPKRWASENRYYAKKPYRAMDVHVTESGGVVAISPTGTICRCHLKPNTICPHEILEPHVDDWAERARYESLSPMKKVMERRRVNKLKEEDNQEKELQADVNVLQTEAAERAKNERERKRRQRLRDARESGANLGKWTYVPRNYDNGFVVEDSGTDSDDDSGGGGGFTDNGGDDADDGISDDLHDGASDEDASDEDEYEDLDSEEDDQTEEAEGGGTQHSLSDDEEVPYLPKSERF